MRDCNYHATLSILADYVYNGKVYGSLTNLDYVKSVIVGMRGEVVNVKISVFAQIIQNVGIS